MIDAPNVSGTSAGTELRRNRKNRIRQMRNVGRVAALVGHDAQLGAFLRQAHDGAQEILSVRRIEPGGAHDQVPRIRSPDGEFTFEFGAAVDACRFHRIGFDVGLRLGAVEHIVGGDVNDRAGVSAGRGCEHGGTVTVDGKRGAGIVLGLVDGRVRCRVDHQIWAQGRQDGSDGRLVQQIEPGPSQCDHIETATRPRDVDERPGELTLRPCHQDFHRSNFHALPALASCRGRLATSPNRSPAYTP